MWRAVAVIWGNSSEKDSVDVDDFLRGRCWGLCRRSRAIERTLQGGNLRWGIANPNCFCVGSKRQRVDGVVLHEPGWFRPDESRIARVLRWTSLGSGNFARRKTNCFLVLRA